MTILIFIFLYFFTNGSPVTSQSSSSTTGSTTTEAMEVRPKPPFDRSSLLFSDLNAQIVASESEFCGWTCILKYENKRVRKRNDCEMCKCDDACFTYGDCCPDVLLGTGKTNGGRGFQCTKVTPDIGDFDSVFLYTIGTCKTTEDREATEKCINATSSSWDVLLPVVDDVTGFAYKNRHCAMCNRISRYTNWLTQIKCSKKEDVINLAKSAMETFAIAMNSDYCNVRFKYPRPDAGDEYVRPCEKVSPEDAISSCNVTGRWTIHSYDPRVEQACLNVLKHVVHRKYKNVFCYMCNVDYSWEYLLWERDSPGKFVVDGVALTALLDFDGSVTVRTSADEATEDIVFDEHASGKHCDNTQMFDPIFDKCRAVSCSNGTRYDGRSCVDVVTATNMYKYTVCLHLHVQTATAINSSDEFLAIHAETTVAPLLDIRMNYSRLLWNGATTIPYIGNNCSPGPYFVVYHVTFSLFSELPVKMTDVMSSIKPVVSSAFDINSTHSIHLHYSQQCINHPFASNMYCANDIKLPFLTEMGEVPPYLLRVVLDSEVRLYSNQMECPYVRLHQSEFEYKLTENTELDMNYVFPNASRVNQSFDGYRSEFYELSLSDVDGILTSDEFQVSNGSAIVCISDYKRFFKLKSTPIAPSDRYLAILSVVCTCISLVFLITTFATYCVMSSLRTTSGVTNMCLVATLFVTQVLYEFGMEQTTMPTACIAIGVLIHLFWLSVLFWMNACTVQLFLKLCFPLHYRTGSFKGIISISALYSFLIPSVIVSVNLIIHVYIEDTIGYGGRLCYINTAGGRRYAFGVPIGMITLINISLYIFTICQMKTKYTSVQKNKESKINMLTCVKLSAITGISWMFGYIYEATKMQVFAYVFTIMVGGQGFLLFLVFVNDNVWKQCKCRRQKLNTSGISRPRDSDATTASTGRSYL